LFYRTIMARNFKRSIHAAVVAILSTCQQF
jgi:hypothetical protein